MLNSVIYICLVVAAVISVVFLQRMISLTARQNLLTITADVTIGIEVKGGGFQTAIDISFQDQENILRCCILRIAEGPEDEPKTIASCYWVTPAQKQAERLAERLVK